MFHIGKEQELDEKLLQKMLKRYRESVAPAIKKAQGYYDGEQAILQKVYADPTKPCSKTVTNYCKNIADTYRGYIASAGYITYRSSGDISELLDILQKNDYQTQDSDFCLFRAWPTSCSMLTNRRRCASDRLTRSNASACSMTALKAICAISCDSTKLTNGTTWTTGRLTYTGRPPSAATL